VEDDELDEIEAHPDYWTQDLYRPEEEEEELAGRGTQSDVRVKAKSMPAKLIRLDGAKMSKVLKSLHQEEVAGTHSNGGFPPYPSIKDLQKKVRLRNLISLCRCNALAPPLDPVPGTTILDTTLNLHHIIQPLPPPPVDTPNDYESVFNFYGTDFNAYAKDFPGISASGLKTRVIQVLGMAMRRGISWALDPEKRHMVDFDDLIWLPVLVKGVTFPRFRVALIDEAQDLSRMRIELVRKSMGTGGRVVAVGDKCQAIYAWSGALPNSLDLLPHAFGELRTFQLPITWRCPRTHVEAAMRMTQVLGRPVRLLARPGAERGVLDYRPGVFDIDQVGAGTVAREVFREGDLVLARLNQPLKLVAWKLGAWGIPHTCSSINVGSRMMTHLKSLGFALPSFPDPHHAVSTRLLTNLKGKIEETADLEKALDPGALLLEIIARLPRAAGHQLKVHALHVELHRIYPALSPTYRNSDPKAAPHLSTVHKAKGLERHRVVWVQPWDCPFFPRGDGLAKWWEKEQETNLIYVAMTRAKEEMVLVDVTCRALSWKYQKLSWLHPKNSGRYRNAFSGAYAAHPAPIAPAVISPPSSPVAVAPAPKTPPKRKQPIQEPTPDVTPAAKKAKSGIAAKSPGTPTKNRGGKRKMLIEGGYSDEEEDEELEDVDDDDEDFSPRRSKGKGKRTLNKGRK